jgi:AraC-like DNA-binding protein
MQMKRRRKTTLRGGQPSFFSGQVTEARRFWRELAPPASAVLAVVSGGREHTSPDYRIERADFPYYSIEFVAGGYGSLALDGRLCPLVPATVFTYGPGVPHAISNHPEQPLVKYFVDFTGKRALRLLEENGLAPGTVVQSSEPQEMMFLFDSLIRNGLKGTVLTTRICRVLLEHMVLQTAETVVPPGSVGSPAFETYQRCRRYIEEHHVELHTLRAVSEACHVDAAHLCRLFRRYDQCTPYQHLVRQRMNRAAEMLRTPGVLVSEVADGLGFSDPFHFSRTFKRVFHVSPSAFMALQREGETGGDQSSDRRTR